MQLIEIKVKTSPHGNDKFLSFDLDWILWAIPTAYKTITIPKGTFNSRSMKHWQQDETIQIMDKSQDVKLILKNGDQVTVTGEWFQYITRMAGHVSYNPKY